MNNFTTFSKTARLSGTEYAASIERIRRNDRSGRIITFVVCALIVVCAYGFSWSRI